ncbi:MAG: type IV pilus secretin PilQ [Pyrinomonadaceae bacterium]
MTFHSNFPHAHTLRGALVLSLVCVLAISARAVGAGVSGAAATESGARSPVQTPAQQPTAPRPSPPQNPGGMTAAANTTQQSSQGQQYGQPGFVGEPIDLNVVNADIRDILNYITEQYGVNFVIDKSVAAVPVTVNVTGVPWNIALDSILKANRLGIDVTGNILRVATNDVIAGEAAVQATIKDARLNNSPLVTEFIRLNYARASGTLEQVAGSSGGFSGGATGQSFSGGAGGGSEQGILAIIKRRLSRRGGIEIDGRSNTLIVTDVRENIDAIRQLVMLLDQPEPQVEIETRIVIASRNFSRDLGVQLSAVAINAQRGGLGSFSTLPGIGDITSGPSPFGIPGGLADSAQPVGSLGATARNTVIGLTTGLIGTAQISALITAGEARGQAKTIASPRVSTLNNRTAQIEAGTQIPVVTPQGAGGGAAVFTTTFVSVPLRLAVTPQITDAGTVVLRVSAENNNVRTDLANSLGTPGINTQRMQTEVLVPDGGTTVIGGSLIDIEGETQNRTPGLASVPLLGNLFKRRATTRNTDEILFFITPRIYRSDYHGRPMAGTVGTSTRIVTIPQPVPLGNPETNTPTPTPQSSVQPLSPQLQSVPFTNEQPLTSQPAARP